jgi:hypothetical protein
LASPTKKSRYRHQSLVLHESIFPSSGGIHRTQFG